MTILPHPYLQALLDGISDPLFILDEQGRIVRVNRAATFLLGVVEEELHARQLCTLFQDLDEETDECMTFNTMLRNGKLREWEVLLRCRGGGLQVALTASALGPGTGVEEFLVVARDLSAHRRSEHEHNRLAAALRSIGEGVYLIDLEGRLRYANPAFERMLGYTEDELLGLEIVELFGSGLNPSRYRELLQSLQSGKVWQGRVTLLNKRREEVPCDTTLSPLLDNQGNIIDFVTVCRDVSERDRLEEQLRQSQKMEAIGRLAGGIAHDFNNLLSVINGYAELLSDTLETDSQPRRFAEAIVQAGEKAAAIIKQLLAFGRKQLLKPLVLDLNKVVGGMEEMVSRLIGEQLEFEVQLAPHPVLVRIDPSQLEQVVLNLALNARDAMPSGGVLRIVTGRNDLTPGLERRGSERAWAVLEVSDSGIGIDRKTRERIFDPFFTTKKDGKGTGMGLATVHGIVEQSGGHIRVESEPGRGSRFRIYLPEVEPQPLQHSPEGSRSIEPSRGSGRVVLLVEDEAGLRDFLERLLEEHGFSVLAAANGEEALGLSRNVPRIDLLLTDVVMPRMNGVQLATNLAKTYPTLAVVLMSGYAKDVVETGDLSKGWRFLEKPFRAALLLATLREVLGTAELPVQPPSA
ncbi:MAG: hypothetical protein A2284_06560 [Deltaproteobacteria bacterium RIFOXYA12_FULL_61_11]|nr:MAG: hypothetical protein A2284_06560 [Deltaproteobacteria bacterium RIFOXYA12_FULL_61_11]